MMHPSLRIIALILLAISVQFLNGPELILVGCVVLALALFSYINLLLKMFFRSRWLLLTLLLVFSFSTPGEYVAWWSVSIAPTYEGIDLGLLQAGRLIIMLAGLSILMGTTPRDSLMAGIFPLLKPLRWIGLSPERFTSRLWLTMHYFEEERQHITRRGWAMLDWAELPAQDAGMERVRFSLPHFSLLDWGVVVSLCFLAGWWLT